MGELKKMPVKTNKILSFFAAAIILPSGASAESVKPDVLFEFCSLPVTNSMLTTWVFVILGILFVRFVLLRGGPKKVPSTGQLVLESIIDALGGILEPITGKKVYKNAMGLLFGLFFFVLMMNWSGLLPGVGSVGREQIATIAPAQAQEYKEQGFTVSELPKEEVQGDKTLKAEKFVPFIRPANSDYNTPFALAMVSFLAWFYFVFRYAGPKTLYDDWFGNKADKSDTPVLIYYLLFPIFFAVGFVEIISAAIRPVSLSCRLFGNVFGGEMLLESMYGMFAYILPLPFCFLELLVGLVQAFIFTLLTAVYIGLLTSHEDAHHEAKPQ